MGATRLNTRLTLIESRFSTDMPANREVDLHNEWLRGSLGAFFAS